LSAIGVPFPFSQPANSPEAFASSHFPFSLFCLPNNFLFPLFHFLPSFLFLSQRSNVQTRQRSSGCCSNSFPCTILANPLTITPYPSTSYKNYREAPLLAHRFLSSLTHLESTLTHHPISVHSKQLTPSLNYLESTLTKKQGGGVVTVNQESQESAHHACMSVCGKMPGATNGQGGGVRRRFAPVDGEAWRVR
jgi:hypothetical protein